ncbi:hypothetical protein GFL15_08940 [Rhizobium leguminosarum bv. viciae]|nr:hypothetical protein [Rhizobium leguminosarum bv. viciae]
MAGLPRQPDRINDPIGLTLPNIAWQFAGLLVLVWQSAIAHGYRNQKHLAFLFGSALRHSPHMLDTDLAEPNKENHR